MSSYRRAPQKMAKTSRADFGPKVIIFIKVGGGKTSRNLCLVVECMRCKLYKFRHTSLNYPSFYFGF